MKVSIDGREIESLTVLPTTTEGGTSSHAISATELVHAKSEKLISAMTTSTPSVWGTTRSRQRTPGLRQAVLLAAALLAPALLRPSSLWRQTGRVPAWPS